MRGQCSCGEVAFEIDADVSGVYFCHCSRCRRATGSNGIAVVVVDKGAFHWTRGEERIATWTMPGTDWQKWFCPTCGSPLPGDNDPARMFIPAGLLDEGAEALVVIHHLWVDSRASWDEIGDGGKQHPTAFEG